MRIKILTLTIAILGIVGCTPPDISIDNLYNNKVVKKEVVKEKKIYKEIGDVKYNTYWNASTEKQNLYSDKMRSIAKKIPEDTTYNKIELNTKENKNWFRGLTYLYWDKQISNSRFIEKGLEKYPNHFYEFQFIVNGMK